PFTDISGSTWDATSIASGSYDLRAEMTDNAGNVAFTAVHTVTVDSTPPALSLASLGTLLSGNLTIDAAVTGASQATLQVRAAVGHGRQGRRAVRAGRSGHHRRRCQRSTRCSGRRRSPHLHRPADRRRRKELDLPHQHDDPGIPGLIHAAADGLEERASEQSN